jgi:hypothetical protein
MYFSLLATLSLVYTARAGQYPFGLEIQGDSCSIPENEVLVALSPELREHIQDSKSCSHHQQQVPSSTISTPWTEQIKCIPKENSTSTYCIYTDDKFANGRGISFFTTPSSMCFRSVFPPDMTVTRVVIRQDFLFEQQILTLRFLCSCGQSLDISCFHGYQNSPL